jgi:hypothetical protein
MFWPAQVSVKSSVLTHFHWKRKLSGEKWAKVVAINCETSDYVHLHTWFPLLLVRAFIRGAHAYKYRPLPTCFISSDVWMRYCATTMVANLCVLILEAVLLSSAVHAMPRDLYGEWRHWYICAFTSQAAGLYSGTTLFEYLIQPVILTKNFRGFPRFFQADTRTISWNRRLPLLTYYLTIIWFDTKTTAVDKAWLNNYQPWPAARFWLWNCRL